MKKHFNIKKISLIVFTFICMLLTMKNVEASDKYVCNYSMGYQVGDSYYDKGNIELRITYENGNYSIGTYDKSTNKYYDSVSSKFDSLSFHAGDQSIPNMHILVLNDTLTEFKKYDFATKKSCPSQIYYVAQLSQRASNAYDFSYYLSSTPLEEYGYSNHNDSSSCYNTHQCGITVLNSSTSGENSNGNSSGNYEKCEYADLSKSVSGSSIEKLFTLKFNSSNIIIEDYDSDFPGQVAPEFQASDLDGKCPNVLYVGTFSGQVAPLSLKKFSGTYSFRVGLIVKFSKDSLTNPDSTVENQICNGSTQKIVSTLYNVIKFLIPAIIIIFSIIDFVGVVLSGENEKMEKAKKRFVTRIIIGLALLFVPSIIELLLRLSGILGKGETLADITCNILS